mgnify:CR=1 FL=1
MGDQWFGTDALLIGYEDVPVVRINPVLPVATILYRPGGPANSARKTYSVQPSAATENPPRMSAPQTPLTAADETVNRLARDSSVATGRVAAPPPSRNGSAFLIDPEPVESGSVDRPESRTSSRRQPHLQEQVVQRLLRPRPFRQRAVGKCLLQQDLQPGILCRVE